MLARCRRNGAARALSRAHCILSLDRATIHETFLYFWRPRSQKNTLVPQALFCSKTHNMPADMAAFLTVDLVEILAHVEAVDPEWWRSASSRTRDDPARLAMHLVRRLPAKVLEHALKNAAGAYVPIEWKPEEERYAAVHLRLRGVRGGVKT